MLLPVFNTTTTSQSGTKQIDAVQHFIRIAIIFTPLSAKVNTTTTGILEYDIIGGLRNIEQKSDKIPGSPSLIVYDF